MTNIKNEDKDERVEKLIEDFSNWAIVNKRLEGSSKGLYGSYLRTYPTKYKSAWINEFNKLKRLPCDICDVLVLLELLRKDGDKLYTLTLVRMMWQFTVNAKKIYNSCYNKKNKKEQINMTNLNNASSAYALLEDFLIEEKYEVNDSMPFTDEENKKLNNFRKNISLKDLNHQLDGMADLLAKVGEELFFQMAIEGSYFFDPKLLETTPAMQKKKYEYKDKTIECYKARNTTDNTIKTQRLQPIAFDKKNNKDIYSYQYVFVKRKKYEVAIDPNGNRFVCELINGSTNLNLGSGKNTIIQNTIISHVWGRAYDPRYFTSLWNIVLIPAWANSLMDKVGSPEKSLASKMRATYMKICKKLYEDYFKDKEYWKRIDLVQAPKIENPKDSRKGTYCVNVVHGKESDNDKNVKIRKKQIIIK